MLLEILWKNRLSLHPYRPKRRYRCRETAPLQQEITQAGDVEPLVVCRNGQPGQFFILDGEKRWTALKRLGDDAPELIAVKIVSESETSRYKARRPNRDDCWSQAEIDFLKEHSGFMSHNEMAEHLERTPSAVNLKRKRLGIATLSNQEDWLTMREAGRAVGVCSKLIGKLVEEGFLKARDYSKERGIKLIYRQHLYRFVVNPRNWPYIIHAIRLPRRMKDKRLRRLVIRQKERWPDEWLSTSEAAEIWGVQHSSVTMKVLRGHYSSAVKFHNWWLRRSEVEATPIYSAGTGHQTRFSPAADAFIIRSRQQGEIWKVIARKMKQPERKVANYARKCLFRGEID